jgi:hypothetical protein
MTHPIYEYKSLWPCSCVLTFSGLTRSTINTMTEKNIWSDPAMTPAKPAQKKTNTPSKPLKTNFGQI